MVRVASRISPLRSLDHDWEKLYVIGTSSIRLLRQLTLTLQELRETFREVLSDQDAIRSQALPQSLPLFPKISGDEERARIIANLETLTDQLDVALKQSDKALSLLGVALDSEPSDAVEISPQS